jgi:photoactive yellow protein
MTASSAASSAAIGTSPTSPAAGTPPSRGAPVSERLYATFDPDRLNALGDEELDALPFGVIALDGDGRIVRYNMAEARFARLDRGQVVGRSFFGEVARCTNTPEFHGRFEELKNKTRTLVRFEYVFAFRFGAQRVDVDMGTLSKAPAAPSSPRVYLCVNRRKFMPRQKDVPAAIEAPLITELEPDAEAAGVVRDAQARRRIEVDMTMLEALFGTVARRDKLGASALLRDWGTSWGKLAVADLETEALEGHGKALGELPMTGAMEIVARYFQRQKLGRISFDYEEAVRGAIAMRVDRCAFAEVAGEAGCATVEGMFGAILSHLAARSLVVRESSCRSKGAEHCQFVAVSASRADAVERAVRGSSMTPRAVVEALGEEARREAR